ncbi:hypothetical protein JHK87_044410 [Glycine soja]|nr:hypothetical protein JHK87_044410 [Glycine soja]
MLISDECTTCHYRTGGQCQLDSRDKFSCTNIGVGLRKFPTMNTNTSCYTTPFSSSPKVNMNKIPTMVKHLVKEGMPLSLGTSTSLNSTVAEFSTDPGFAERAAKLSCFGSRSFNGRTTQLCLNIAELA